MSNVPRTIHAAVALALAAAVAPHAQAQQAEPAAAGLEEIVVTARKRNEDLQEVPVAATAFSASDLERQQAFGLEDLHLSVPNMTITRNNTGSNGAQIYIRGIGRDNSTWNEESGVAVYVDDVYMSQQIGSLLDFNDFERIEVLRGPQGTLYGRNATSGAVKFVLRRPQFEPLYGGADVTFGSYDRLDVRGRLGGEVVDDRLAVKIDVASRTGGEYVRRPATSPIKPEEKLNGLDRQSARLAALFQATDATEVYLVADYTEASDDLNTPISIVSDGAGGFRPRFNSLYVSDPGVPNDNSFKGYTLNGQVSVDFGGWQLKSITAYRSIDDRLNGDLDGFTGLPLDFRQRTEFDTLTQEFQFNGAVGRATYVAGVYFLREDLSANALNVFLGGLRTLSDQETTSYAAYADVSLPLADRFDLSVGGRYTRDEKDVSQSAIRSTGVAAFTDVAGSKAWTEFSPRIALDFQAMPNLLIYASWGKGFKAGAVANGRPPTADQANVFTEPEVSATIEAGVKSQWADNRLRLNLAVFDTKYENQQASFRDTATNVIRVVAADAKIRGAELEATWLPVDALTLSLNVGWLDSEYTDVQPGHPAFAVRSTVQLKQVPKHSGRLSAEYRLPLSALGGELLLGASYLRSAAIPRDIANNPIATTPAYSVVDAQVGYESDDGRWRIGVGGENLTGETYWTMATAPFARFYAPKRTWSATLRYNF
jgi:iron complex outermembrane receptor protein